MIDRVVLRNPLYTGHKLNEYKTFKQRAGRLLNDLCTLNLQPISEGQKRLC